MKMFWFDEDHWSVSAIGEELHVHQSHYGEGAATHATYHGPQSAAFALRTIARRLRSQATVYEAWSDRLFMAERLIPLEEIFSTTRPQALTSLVESIGKWAVSGAGYPEGSHIAELMTIYAEELLAKAEGTSK